MEISRVKSKKKNKSGLVMRMEALELHASEVADKKL